MVLKYLCNKFSYWILQNFSHGNYLFIFSNDKIYLFIFPKDEIYAHTSFKKPRLSGYYDNWSCRLSHAPLTNKGPPITWCGIKGQWKRVWIAGRKAKKLFPRITNNVRAGLLPARRCRSSFCKRVFMISLLEEKN